LSYLRRVKQYNFDEMSPTHAQLDIILPRLSGVDNLTSWPDYVLSKGRNQLRPKRSYRIYSL